MEVWLKFVEAEELQQYKGHVTDKMNTAVIHEFFVGNMLHPKYRGIYS